MQRHWPSICNWVAGPGLLVVTLTAFKPSPVLAENCTYRKDSLGNTRYQCKVGKTGTLRTDSLGNVRDSGSGSTWRKDSLGNVRGSDGTTYRQDSLGNVRSSNTKTGEKVTWRKDSLGNLRASDGSVCRTDSLGTLRSDGCTTSRWPRPMMKHTRYSTAQWSRLMSNVQGPWSDYAKTGMSCWHSMIFRPSSGSASGRPIR